MTQSKCTGRLYSIHCDPQQVTYFTEDVHAVAAAGRSSATHSEKQCRWDSGPGWPAEKDSWSWWSSRALDTSSVLGEHPEQMWRIGHLCGLHQTGTDHGSFDRLMLAHIWPPHAYAHGTDHGSFGHITYVHMVLIIVHLTTSRLCTWYWSWFIWPPHACAHGTNHGSYDHITLMHMLLIMFIWPPHTCEHGTDHGSFDRLMLVNMVLIMVHLTTSCLHGSFYHILAHIWPPHACTHGTDHGSFDHLMLAYMLSAF